MHMEAMSGYGVFHGETPSHGSLTGEANEERQQNAWIHLDR